MNNMELSLSLAVPCSCPACCERLCLVHEVTVVWTAWLDHCVTAISVSLIKIQQLFLST